MRRAAVSVPSNSVEGCARESQTEFLRFLEIAFASLRELRYQFGLSKRLEYVEENSFVHYEAPSAKVWDAIKASYFHYHRRDAETRRSLEIDKLNV